MTSPVPGLPESVRAFCQRHGWASTVQGAACPRCKRARPPVEGTSGVGGAAETEAGIVPPARSIRPRPGQQHEDALYAALGGLWWEASPNGYPSEARFFGTMWLRQYPWGSFLEPARKYVADVGFPCAGLLVEIEGGAHAVKRQRKHDVLRRQLAESAGWRVLSVLPEQVKDGSALALVRAALAAKEER